MAAALEESRDAVDEPGRESLHSQADVASEICENRILEGWGADRRWYKLDAGSSTVAIVGGEESGWWWCCGQDGLGGC